MYVTPETFGNIVEECRRLKRSYTVTTTSSSRKLLVGGVRYFSSDYYLGQGAISHIVKVKRMVLERAGKVALDFAASSKFFNFYEVGDYMVDRCLPTFREGVCEYDLSHAYWRTAFDLSLIDEDTYKLFLTFRTKRLRLLALGSIAKTEKIDSYNARGELESSEVRSDMYGKAIFRHLSWLVTAEMRRLAYEYRVYGFLFYWVDNIVFTGAIRGVRLNTPYDYKVSEGVAVMQRRRHLFSIKIGKRFFQLPARGERGGGLRESR